MNNSVATPCFEPSQVVVANMPDKEEDSKEDPKEDSNEVENTEGSEDSKNFMDSNGSEYHWDPKNFDPWDD